MTDGNDRYDLLCSYLEHDPDNTELLRDTAIAALDANQAAAAFELFVQLESIRALEPAEINFKAIAAMRSGRPQLAVDAFATLRELDPDDPALSFNHAWSLSLAGRFDEATDALSPEAVGQLPQAAMLQIQIAHQAGQFEEADELAHQHLETFPDYPPLLAAVSVLAMDVDNEELARQCAEAAGDHPDALTTMGLLSLGDSKPDEALTLFQRSMELQPQSPRAQIGFGLTKLMLGEPAVAGEWLDRGATIFGDHLGSWIASGWSYLVAGDAATARQRFEHALELDPTFAETHGSLAVIDILDGKLEEAERRSETALRLDRQCFSASYARLLIAAGAGDQQKAERILEIALKQPLGNSGRTLADAIAKLAM